MMVSRQQLIKEYVGFFKSKSHKEIPNSSLLPSNDPTVLFTTAGMHPLVPYLAGQRHSLGKKLVGLQKCIRTGDIEEVGDKVHHTFFEMLGNWSLGDYWKEEAISLSLEFLEKKLKIPKSKMSVTCFKGDKDAPKDKESARAWISLGIPKSRIKFLSKKENWWGPAGKTGPCGPDTEMFVNGIEIWNNVFMEYKKTEEGEYSPLSQKNVDTGMGVERTLAALQGTTDNYTTEIWKPIIKEIEHLYKIKYSSSKNKRLIRIIADHAKAAVFIAAEEITPSNKGRGYVLRKLIRRAYRILYSNDQRGNLITGLIDKIIETYPDYEHLKDNRKKIYDAINKEEEKFEKTLQKGINEFRKLTKNKKSLSGKNAFLLYQSYGFPVEITSDLAKENKIKFNISEFQKELAKHQKLSRTTSADTFKSGLADSSEETKRLHTATHLLNASLKKVLGEEIKQRGSNITSERLRFDFNFPRKLTEEEIKKVQDLVNRKIKQGLKIKKEEMSLKKALGAGSEAEFGHKYPGKVSVYTISDPTEKKGWFSREICTGPHVKNTEELGHFRIIKEESSSAGIRRIKAVLE